MADWKIIREDAYCAIYGVALVIVSISVTILWGTMLLLSIPIGISMDIYNTLKEKICKKQS